jgi:serine/threonine protein kinase
MTSPSRGSTGWTQDLDNPNVSFKYIQEYTPPGVIRRIGAGNSFFVGLLEDGTVLKYPLEEGKDMKSLTIENAIYEALGHHKRIVRCLGITERGLRMEFASQGRVTDYLSKGPSTKLRLRWCRQAAEAVAFLHSKGVIHCDLHTNNLLLDDQLNALLSDFQGTFKDLDGYAMESSRYFLPREATSPPNEITDIFALGTLMYTIMVGVEPYPDLSDTEVEGRYRRQKFPETDNIVCGRMILRCWSGEYASAKEVFQDLKLLE